MTLDPLCPPMPRRRIVLLAGVTLIALLCGTPLSAMGQEGVPEPEQGRILIVLHATTSPHGEPPHLLYALVFNTTVDGDADHRDVRAPLPHGATLDRFTPYEEHQSPGDTRIENETGTQWAITEWGEGGPLPGSELAMRLDARQEVSPREVIDVNWTHLPELTSARVFLPSSYTPVVDADHEIQREQSMSGLVGWNLTRPPSEHLTMQLRPVETGTDPSLAAPPPPWSAFAVVLALIVASGGLWFLGKKLDARKPQREDPE